MDDRTDMKEEFSQADIERMKQEDERQEQRAKRGISKRQDGRHTNKAIKKFNSKCNILLTSVRNKYWREFQKNPPKDEAEQMDRLKSAKLLYLNKVKIEADKVFLKYEDINIKRAAHYFDQEMSRFLKEKAND